MSFVCRLGRIRCSVCNLGRAWGGLSKVAKVDVSGSMAKSGFISLLSVSHYLAFTTSDQMEALRGLKAFGHVCPFLQHSTVSKLRTLSTQALSASSGAASSNRLAYLAQTKCPLMSIAYAAKSQSYSTASIASSSQIPAFSTGRRRGYASIAEQHAETARLQREQAQAAAKQAAAVTGQTGGIASEQAADPERVFYAGRPTTALGFAKHVVTSHRPGQFNYEQFYTVELDKKHKDKSYRVSNPRARD